MADAHRAGSVGRCPRDVARNRAARPLGDPAGHGRRVRRCGAFRGVVRAVGGGPRPVVVPVVALYLVRHGRPVIDPSVPASAWTLDPGYEHLVTDLAARAPWSADAVWFTSPEPKAARTARLLAGRDVLLVADLREHERRGTGLIPDFVDAVGEAFANPNSEIRPGWEPVARTRSRVAAAVLRILEQHPGRDVVTS